MSHTDYIEKAPEGFKIVSNTPVYPVAGMECEEKDLHAVQFHPELKSRPNKPHKLFIGFIKAALEESKTK